MIEPKCPLCGEFAIEGSPAIGRRCENGHTWGDGLKDDQFDVGDKLACSLGFKKNVGNYSSLDFHVSVSIVKRKYESDEQFTSRGWSAAQDQLEWQVAKEAAILEVIRPVVGSADEWN